MPPADELRRLVYLHGGRYQQYYTKRTVTHIIATNLPNSKIQEIRYIGNLLLFVFFFFGCAEIKINPTDQINAVKTFYMKILRHSIGPDKEM